MGTVTRTRASEEHVYYGLSFGITEKQTRWIQSCQVVELWNSHLELRRPQSNAWTVFARSNAEIVGSNSTRDMDVYVRLFCVCAILCAGSGLVTGSATVRIDR
jgi:hypothetical protein